MAELNIVEVPSAPIERYRPLLEPRAWSEFSQALTDLAATLRGRVVWNINSTARGGGVAELLAALIPYDRGAGIDERWVVIQGAPEFFQVTKRIHSLLHGAPSGGTEFSRAERDIYEKTLAENATALVELIRPTDIAIIHDPQAAGLVPTLRAHGCPVIWRSHVGVDRPNDAARQAWDMLRPYLDTASALVFSRSAYVWEGLDRNRVSIIAPCIDPFDAKNQELTEPVVEAILMASGLMQGRGGQAVFTRNDGTQGTVARKAAPGEPDLPPDARVVLQVSRWDQLKDPMGLLESFGKYVRPRTDSWLVLAGPGASSVRDDPEQPAVLQEVLQTREQFAPDVRGRIVIAQLPMDDEEENAAIVNALQRRADVVVQKSLAEGFGLTVAEAMWKGRAVVASRVGGIEDQIEHEVSGLLVDDPKDLRAFGEAISGLLESQAEATRLGGQARSRVLAHFLAPRYLTQQAKLISSVAA